MAIQSGAQAFLMHARLPPFTIPEPRVAEGAPRDIATMELLVVVSLQNWSGLNSRANGSGVNTRSHVEACRAWGSSVLALALAAQQYTVGPGEKTRGNQVNSHLTLLAGAREQVYHECRSKSTN